MVFTRSTLIKIVAYGHSDKQTDFYTAGRNETKRILTEFIPKWVVIIKDGCKMYIVNSKNADNTIINMHKLNEVFIIYKSQRCKNHSISIRKPQGLSADFALSFKLI